LAKTIKRAEMVWSGIRSQFYEMIWILKFSFKHLNEIDIFSFGLKEPKQYLDDISCINSFKAVFTFKMSISFNL
jgi:hypothetical protein